MQFVLNIKTDGSAFTGEQENPFGDDTGREVARILNVVAERLEDLSHATARDKDDPFLLMDLNGASVGMAYFEETD